MLPITSLDHTVRNTIYRYFLDHDKAPLPPEVAEAANLSVEEVVQAYEHLSAAHVLVLEQGSHQILMAMPFSGVPTRYRVSIMGHHYFANCAWDALGIAAMLGTTAHIQATCPDCNKPLDVSIRNGSVSGNAGAAIHFAVPAAHWWDDIVYT